MMDIGKFISLLKEKLRILGRCLNESIILKTGVPETSEGEYSLVSLVNKAHREWIQAKKLFDEVKDPDLVDHAIYAVEAAEKKYMYLLKLARKEQAVDEELREVGKKELA